MDEPRHGQNSRKQNIASHDLERLNQFFIGGEMQVPMSQNHDDTAATIIGCKEVDPRKWPFSWKCGQSRNQADAKPYAQVRVQRRNYGNEQQSDMTEEHARTTVESEACAVFRN